jgi:hypothetical protein
MRCAWMRFHIWSSATAPAARIFRKRTPSSRKLRAAKSMPNYSNRMILAEANQWPTDVRPYFGDGDECHMAFHFPANAAHLHGAAPGRSSAHHGHHGADSGNSRHRANGALFLRNHDELTLEMVTNDERDYMYLAYSAIRECDINLGIRRRLAPLLDNNRRRIELLNSLLLVLPGNSDPVLRRRNRDGRQHLSRAIATASELPCSGIATAMRAFSTGHARAVVQPRRSWIPCGVTKR